MDPRFEAHRRQRGCRDRRLPPARRDTSGDQAIAAARLPLLGVEGLRARASTTFNLPHRRLARSVAPPRRRCARPWVELPSLLLGEQTDRVPPPRVFTGSFTLQTAQAVVGDSAVDRWAALDPWARWTKSLVLARRRGRTAPLLETARAYAVERLAEAGGDTGHHPAARRGVLLRTLKAILRGGRRRHAHGRQLHAASRLEVDNLRAALMLAGMRIRRSRSRCSALVARLERRVAYRGRSSSVASSTPVPMRDHPQDGAHLRLTRQSRALFNRRMPTKPRYARRKIRCARRRRQPLRCPGESGDMGIPLLPGRRDGADGGGGREPRHRTGDAHPAPG